MAKEKKDKGKKKEKVSSIKEKIREKMEEKEEMNMDTEETKTSETPSEEHMEEEIAVADKELSEESTMSMENEPSKEEETDAPIEITAEPTSDEPTPETTPKQSMVSKEVQPKPINEIKDETPQPEMKKEEPREERTSVLWSYSFSNEGIPVQIKILTVGDFVPHYEITVPSVDAWTKKMLEGKLRGELMSEVKLDLSEILDPKKYDEVKAKFMQGARNIIDRNFKEQLPDPQARRVLSVYLMQNALGLGKLESLLGDENLEEVVINNAREPVWVYHKKSGWCKTNIFLDSEAQIYDYASMIARKIGRQINILNPTLDAHLPSGDRVNATLAPISQFGNTLTIRKFSKNPWTITTLIKSATISPEVAGLIWLCIQNELSLLVAGGTGSGKTSFLNAMSAFIPPNQRIISIEDTRELTLPKFLQWVPMMVREANPEGKGEITMLDLLVNALRQRPDRILVGEIRRQREAEILFEAIHTGHSVYATLHADNTDQAISRLINPPISIPPQMLDAVSGVIVTFRHRRFNIRRILEVSEMLKQGKYNTLYRWTIKESGSGFTDKIKQVAKMTRLADQLSLYAGMDEREIVEDVAEKVAVLKWMVDKDYSDVDQVGRIVSHYYVDPDDLLQTVRKNRPWNFSE